MCGDSGVLGGGLRKGIAAAPDAEHVGSGVGEGVGGRRGRFRIRRR